jgi:chromate transporter
MEKNIVAPNYGLSELALYFLKLGTIGFGGPVALVGAMNRDLVEDKKWIGEDDYKEGLALSQLAPGPLAAQLAIYLGFVHYRILGATLCGIAFVLPSFLMVLGLGYVYTLYQGLPGLQAIFYGIGPATIAIIALSSYKLSKKTLGKDLLLWSIFLPMAAYTFYFETESLWLILLAGLIVLLIKVKFSWPKKAGLFIPIPLIIGIYLSEATTFKLGQMAWFFAKAGAFVFGSGLAIVPFLYGGVVKEFGWLTESQFLDAVAVAMITPGPVVITVGFIGYLTAGPIGACVAALATFLPCYLFTIIPAPYFKKYGKRPGIKAFVDGVSVAAIGAIAGAVGVLAIRQIQDLTGLGIALVSVLVLIYVKKINEPILILIAGIIGWALKTWL